MWRAGPVRMLSRVIAGAPHAAHVGARRERAVAGARDDRHPQLRIVAEGEPGVVQLDVHRAVERVQRLRPVERDHGDSPCGSYRTAMAAPPSFARSGRQPRYHAASDISYSLESRRVLASPSVSTSLPRLRASGAPSAIRRGRRVGHRRRGRSMRRGLPAARPACALALLGTGPSACCTIARRRSCPSVCCVR